MKRPYNRIPSIACPHCGARATTRDSEVVDRLTRDLWLFCQNVETCGHSFVAQLSIIRTVRPSDNPNAVVASLLPLSPWRHLPANDDTKEPMNDNGPGDAPAAAEITPPS